MLHIELTPEQAMLQDAAEKYMAAEYGFEERRRMLATPGEVAAGKWRDYAEMGWLALPFAEDSGGADGTAFDVFLLMQSFGRALAVEPYLASVVLAGQTLAAAGSIEQRRLVADLIAGSRRLAFGIGEPRSGYNPCDVETRAIGQGAGFTLTGHKAVVLGAAGASHLIVSARSGGERRDRDGISLFLVEANSPGLKLRPYSTIDGRRAAEVLLDRVAVRADQLVGTLHGAAPLIEQAQLRGSVALLGEAVGCLEGALVATIEFLKNRQQFGQKLADFQALRHRVADMYIAKEETKALCVLAAHSVANDSTDAVEAVAAAKAYVGQVGRHITEEAVQLNGAIAITDEYSVGHYLKRMLAIDRMFADTSQALDTYLSLRGAFDGASATA